jgi:hypothetical protein
MLGSAPAFYFFFPDFVDIVFVGHRLILNQRTRHFKKYVEPPLDAGQACALFVRAAHGLSYSLGSIAGGHSSTTILPSVWRSKVGA